VEALAEIVKEMGWLVLLLKPLNAGMVAVFPEEGKTAPKPLGKGLCTDQLNVVLAVVEFIVTCCEFPPLQTV